MRAGIRMWAGLDDDAVNAMKPARPSGKKVPDAIFVAKSPVMKRIQEQARRASKVDTTVLITGEFGVGKTHLAKEIHRASPRGDRPFIRFPAAQARSDGRLFGSVNERHDTTQARYGAIQRAEGGTLMIDEIAALWPTSQARLLGAIETGTVAPLGGSSEEAIDVRVIASTSKNLDMEVRAGRFRQDLLYRISVLPIHLPPLRLRREDIPDLVREFLRRIDDQSNGHAFEIAPDQIHILKSLDWPRNIQQLREVVENMIFPRGHPDTKRNTDPVDTPLAVVERDTILAALDAHDGNRTRTAESLGISVRTLQRRLRQWHLDH